MPESESESVRRGSEVRKDYSVLTTAELDMRDRESRVVVPE